MDIDSKNSEPAPDAFSELSAVSTSRTIEVLRQVTQNGESFIVSHELRAPYQFQNRAIAGSGLIRHRIATLTHLHRYVDKRREKTPELATVAFFGNEGVTVVLDEKASQHEVLTCTIDRHPKFLRWMRMVSESQKEGLSQASFVNLLRMNRDALDGDQVSDHLIGCFESLRGSLTHDADEFRDMKSRSSTFTVRRKVRGKESDATVESVPLEFTIEVPLLLDSGETMLSLRILIDIRGGAGACPLFVLAVENLDDIVTDHIELRLEQFEAMAGYLCVRGAYSMQQPSELGLPKVTAEFLDKHAAMLKAQHRGE